MNFIRKNLVWVLVIAVCGTGYVIYANYFSNPSSSDILSSSTSSSTPVGSDLLPILSDLKSVNLDDSIFSDPAFLSLVDFGVALPIQSVGRPDPFAPLGSQGAQGGNAGVLPNAVKSANH